MLLKMDITRKEANGRRSHIYRIDFHFQQSCLIVRHCSRPYQWANTEYHYQLR